MLKNQFLILVSIFFFGMGVLSFGQPGDLKKSLENKSEKSAPGETKAKEDPAISIARDQAKLMHQVYESTLETMHQHYFRADHPVLPARALEEIFGDISKKTNVQARWISVNTKPMSIHHEPKTAFEKSASSVLSGGKREFEQVEDGYYRRAGVIRLGQGCLTCHSGFFAKLPSTPRFAGLVISIPLKKE